MNNEAINNNAVAYQNKFSFEGAKISVHETKTYSSADDNQIHMDVEIGAMEGSIVIDNAGWIENLKAGVTIACCLIKEAPGAVLPIIKELIGLSRAIRDEAREYNQTEREARYAERAAEREERAAARAHELALKQLELEYRYSKNHEE